jgi:Kef-type K+ transport system membrane component KefB
LDNLPLNGAGQAVPHTAACAWYPAECLGDGDRPSAKGGNVGPVLVLGVIVCVGLVCGELAEKLRLPKITGYILAGIVLNPEVTGIVPASFVAHADPITNIALAFITFSVGGTLLWSRIKSLGKSIVFITLFEAEFAFLAVVGGFMLLGLLFPGFLAGGFLTAVLPMSLLIGCLGSPTDPSATLAVVHEYHAKGEVTSTVMGVAAFDDALGIVNFSIAVAVATALLSRSQAALPSAVATPMLEIGGGILLGVAAGLLLNAVARFVRREGEGALIVLVLGLLTLTFGVAHLLGADELLALMTMGAVVANLCHIQRKIFGLLERYTEELIFVLFFTISGMHLNFGVLFSSMTLVGAFVLFRAAGKFSGTMLGAALGGAHPKVRRFAAGGLIPQGGIVIGLALLLRQREGFERISQVVINVILGATVIHELVGPVLAHWALKAAGEIKGGLPRTE